MASLFLKNSLGVVMWAIGASLLFVGLTSGLGGFALYFSLAEVGALSGDVSLVLDGVSLVFLGVVSLVTGSVFVFSSEYMESEVYEPRFQVIVMMFVGSMMWLVASGNLVSVVLGWDGLGVISFALVIFYQQPKSLGAGMVTGLVNRVGDVFLISALALNLCVSGDSVGSSVVWGLVLVAGMTKSAQFPFSCWLPAAMAAPTPVSALVHSSTLVTAGVVLLMRSEFQGSSLLLWVAVITALGAGLSGIFENDGKKVIALSTLSQLGFMMIAVSLNELGIALAHLMMHALFKSMLFICFGATIMYNAHEQDLRRLGGGWDSIRCASAGAQLSAGALCGLPFLSGFYSKDSILELVAVVESGQMVLLGVVSSALLTGMYSVRLLWSGLYKAPSGASMMFKVEESSFCSSIGILCLGSVVGGRVLWPTDDCSGPYFMAQDTKCFLTVLSVVGVAVMVAVMEHSGRSFSSSFWSSMGYLNAISGELASLKGLKMGAAVEKYIEKGWLEYLGPGGAFKGFDEVLKRLGASTVLSPRLSLNLSFRGSVLGMLVLFLAWAAVGK